MRERGGRTATLREPVRPFDLRALKTVALAERPSKVAREDLGTPLAGDAFGHRFLAALPKQLAADGLRRLVRRLVQGQRDGRLSAVALGGHVVKTGCVPYLIDFLRRGVFGAVAMNGAAAIHDLEIAVAGHTSEDVGARLLAGTFGMARETAELYAAAAARARLSGEGLGRALGAELDELDCPYADASLLVQAYRLDVPCTVHVGMGTDVVHMHPCLDGADLGAATHTDFRKLTSVVAEMSGGLWMNLGCAVVMPEVFLKAIAILGNFGVGPKDLATANLDMVQQYRGRVNVCQRPTEEGIMLTGHHEIMVPLVHALVAAELDAPRAARQPGEGQRQS